MFGNSHPRPPHRKEVAMQIVRQQQRACAATELTVDPPGGEVAPPPQAPAIRINVTYTLADYLGILRAHLRFLLRHAAPAERLRRACLPLVLGVLAGGAAWLAGPGWTGAAFAAFGALSLLSLPFTLDLWIALLAPPVFYLKKRRMPACEFRIDGHGIARSSRLGVFERSWDEVKMVRRYERGYLLVFAQGGIPLPLRCMDQRQQEQLRAWTARRAAGGAA